MIKKEDVDWRVSENLPDLPSFPKSQVAQAYLSLATELRKPHPLREKAAILFYEAALEGDKEACDWLESQVSIVDANEYPLIYTPLVQAIILHGRANILQLTDSARANALYSRVLDLYKARFALGDAKVCDWLCRLDGYENFDFFCYLDESYATNFNQAVQGNNENLDWLVSIMKNPPERYMDKQFEILLLWLNSKTFKDFWFVGRTEDIRLNSLRRILNALIQNVIQRDTTIGFYSSSENHSFMAITFRDEEAYRLASENKWLSQYNKIKLDKEFNINADKYLLITADDFEGFKRTLEALLVSPQ